MLPLRAQFHLLTALLMQSLGLHFPSATAAEVLTQHNNNARTGAILQETELTTSNVTVARFGKLYTRAVQGQISGQILYVPGVQIAGGVARNVVYVTTMENKVYAFDADTDQGVYADPLWGPVSLGAPVPHTAADPLRYSNNGYNTQPFIGVMSTPTIDRASNKMFVVAKTFDNSVFRFRIFAIDLRSGAIVDRNDAIAAASSAFPGESEVCGVDSNGRIPFDHRLQQQRPGLLLLRGRLYVAFGGWQDTRPFHGWVLVFNASNLSQITHHYNTTKAGCEGGIWQAGAGLVGEQQSCASTTCDDVYFMVGNGGQEMSFSPNTNVNRYQSFTRISLDTHHANSWELMTADYFAPPNIDSESWWDADLGASGPLWIPGTRLLIGAGKEGTAHLVNMDNMGTWRGNWGSQSVQDFYVCDGSVFPAHGHVHGSPVFWADPKSATPGGLTYFWCENGPLQAFRFNGSLFNTTPELVSSVYAPLEGMPGGQLSLSANGATAGTGIVWATVILSSETPCDGLNTICPGVFRAFDASTLRELWNSEQNAARDAVGNFAKGPPVTVANGRVYVPTFSGAFHVYGLLNNAKFVSQTAPPEIMAPGATANVSVTMNNTGGAWSSDARHRLGSQNPQDNGQWGISRLSLPANTRVPHGQSYTFQMTIKAPTTPGLYNFQWKMLQEGVEWFGGASPNVAVQVTNGIALSVDPSTRIVEEGSSTTYCVAPMPQAGYTPASNATFRIDSVTGLSGDTWSWAPSTCGGAKSALITVTAGEIGQRTLTIKGSYNQPYAQGTASATLSVKCKKVFDPEIRAYVCQ